jgi:hypothetical protein
VNVGDSLSQSRCTCGSFGPPRTLPVSLSLYAFVRSFVRFFRLIFSSSSSSPPSMQRHIEDKSERRYTGKQHTHTHTRTGAGGTEWHPMKMFCVDVSQCVHIHTYRRIVAVLASFLTSTLRVHELCILDCTNTLF